MKHDDNAFDRVVLTSETGTQDLTVDQFLLIPLPTRVRYLLESRLQFFRGTAPVNPRVALNSMRSRVGVRPSAP